MSAADSRQIVDKATGATLTVPYRQAVGLVSRGLAEWAPKPKPAPRKRAPKPKVKTEEVKAADLSGDVVKADADSAENEPSASDLI